MSRFIGWLQCSALVCLFLSFHSSSGQRLADPYCSHIQHVKKSMSATARTMSSLDDYDVKFYFLDIEADNLSVFIKAKVSMKAQVVNPMSELVLGLSDMFTVDSVQVNGQKLSFTHSDDNITIALGETLDAGTFLVSTVYYSGSGETRGFFSGISNGIAENGKKITWTLSEPENAIDWFACKQVLEDKADSAYIFVTVPADLEVGSNGLLKNVVEIEGSKKRYEWKTNYPIAYYLISMAIGDYDEHIVFATLDGKEMPIQSFVYKNMLETYKPSLDGVKDMVEGLSALYGPYPFADEKYGHAMAPMGGGMEHQTMSTMASFNFTLNAHELGHQWFGDNVTCATWQDIWLNEGFARYSEYLMLEKLQGKSIADGWMTGNYNHVLTVPNGSVHVPLEFADDEGRIFDFRLTYNKGGALVHMIRNIIDNDDVFFNVLKAYQTEYRNTVASAEDFQRVLEEQSNMDFDNFFSEYYYGEGHPVYKIRWNYFADSVYIKQIQNGSSTTPYFHIPVEYKLEFAEGDTTVTVNSDTSGEVFSFYTGKPVLKITIDPEKWLLKKVESVVRDYALKPLVVTAVEEDLAELFNVYPNPATGQAKIRPADARIYSFEILNSLGSVVNEQKGNRGEVSVNTSQFSEGVYALRIHTADGFVTIKLAIRK